MHRTFTKGASMSRHAHLIAIAASVAFLGGCTGLVSDAQSQGSAELTVATLKLKMDPYGALQIEECLNVDGECTPLPNNFGCDKLEIDIKGDARTHVRCYMDGQLVEDKLATVADGVPIVCKASPDRGCQSCFDIYGTPVLDTCNRGTQMYRRTGGGWGNKDNDIPGVAVVPGGSDTSPPGIDPGNNGGGDTPGGDTPGGGDTPV
jgi:hypothetical protein